MQLKAVEVGDIIIALKDGFQLNQGDVAQITAIFPNEGVANTTKGWISLQWEGQNWVTQADAKKFTEFDVGREIIYLVNIGENKRGTLTSIRRYTWENNDGTSNYGEQAETWLRDKINYVDQGKTWAFNDGNSSTGSEPHPSTAIVTVPYHVGHWFKGVQIIQEVLVTWNLRFFDGTDDYPNRDHLNDQYPAYCANQEQIENIQIGRTWGWDNYKTFQNGINYKLVGCFKPEDIRSEHIAVAGGFTAIENGRVLNPLAMEMHRHQTDLQITNAPRDIRLYIIIYGKKQNEYWDNQVLELLFKPTWSYDGTPLL